MARKAQASLFMLLNGLLMETQKTNALLAQIAEQTKPAKRPVKKGT